MALQPADIACGEELAGSSWSRAIYKTVSSGAGFGASPLCQEIGLGQAQGIESVEIFWPTSGETQVLRGFSTDRFYSVREGDAAPVVLNLRSFTLRPPLEKYCGPAGGGFPVSSPAGK